MTPRTRKIVGALCLMPFALVLTLALYVSGFDAGRLLLFAGILVCALLALKGFELLNDNLWWD